MPKRIRLSRAKGWRMPPGTVNVARPHKFGNPLIVGKHGTRADCVEYLALALCNQMVLTLVDLQLLQLYRDAAWGAIEQLRGRDVACWCPLDGKPCHGDVLLHLWNRAPDEPFNIRPWQRGPLIRVT